MRDVEALCDRVIVINHGHLIYDGPLARIVERFSETKLVKLQFEGEAPEDLGRFGEVVRRDGPWADVKVGRSQVAAVLAAVLDRHAVADVSVEEPPLEEVITRVFEEARAGHDAA
jgi:ABC-2 type transport system ATP-binding protein